MRITIGLDQRERLREHHLRNIAFGSRAMSGSSESAALADLAKSPKFIATVVVAIVVTIFIAQNRTRMELRLIFFRLSMPVWVAFAVLVLIGIGIGWMLKSQRIKRRS